MLFFDNRADEVADMIRGVSATAIHVRDDIPHPRVKDRTDSMAYPRSFPENPYARIVEEAGGEETMPSLGLTRTHVARLDRWMQRAREPKIVVFDWDQTLTVVDGVILPSDQEWRRDGWPLLDTLLYLFGGAERLRMIREMFSRLRAAKVHVFINTRNTSCIQTPLAYQALIKAIDPRMDAAHIVCAGARRSKATALRANRAYRDLMRDTHRHTRHLKRHRPNE